MCFAHNASVALLVLCAVVCEPGCGGASSCGGVTVETCDDTPNPDGSSGTVTGVFNEEELVFDIDMAEVSDCAPPMSVYLHSTVADGSDTSAYSFEARFRLLEDGSFDASYHDFQLYYYEDGDGQLYHSTYTSGDVLTQTGMDVVIDEIGTWTLQGRFDGWLEGALDDEGSSVTLSGSFDASTEAERWLCD